MKTIINVPNLNKIIKQLEKYNIFYSFESEIELTKWISQLNNVQIDNFLSLNIKPEKILFDTELLIDSNLLNTNDYLNRVKAFISIENADGWYHLFNYMVRPEFLNSDKFYQDIETLKRAKCAQTPLWIIGDPIFINSPYHDEDFELLVTSKDLSENDCDYVVWDAIATIAKNEDSIESEYHRQDLQTIVKYGATSLQISYSYPEGSINNLAVNSVSLKDRYHLENMEILAQNHEIGNFLYAVMTDEETIKKNNYRRIIQEMVDNKENKAYVFLVCCYAIGEAKAKDAQNICLHNYFYEISSSYDIPELLKKIDEKINVIDADFKEVVTYEIECYDRSYIKKSFLDKPKSLVKSILKRSK